MEEKSVPHRGECFGATVLPNAGAERTQASNGSNGLGSGNGTLGAPKTFSTCRRWMMSGRFQDILPGESLTMSLADWEDLYHRERQAQVHHSVYTTSGCFLQLDQRQLVMSWISDVAHRLAWEKSTFHIATGLIDQYMFCLERDPASRRRLDRSSLAATFAAAVVTAASLGECLGECHDRRHCPGLPPLHRFVQSSGIIRSSRDIVEMQIQLLVKTSRYGGPSLLNKTPAHMTLHYLSRLKHLVDSLSGGAPPNSSRAPGSQNKENEAPCCKKGACWAARIGLGTTVGQAVLGIREKINYALLFEKIMFAHELALYSGINLLVPGSRIAACVLVNILISFDPILQFPSHQNLLYNGLCLLDYETGIRPFLLYLDPLVRRVVPMTQESILALESPGSKQGPARGGYVVAPWDNGCTGAVLIHKHHVIPEKLLSGLWVSTLIAMHSRMNQPSALTPLSLSSPSSIPVSPHSSLGSGSGSPSSLQCSPLFYPLSGAKCCLEEKSHCPGKGGPIGTGGGFHFGGVLGALRAQSFEGSGGASGERVFAEDAGKESRLDSAEFGKDSVSLKLLQKQQGHGHLTGHHLHFLSSRGSDDQHLYTTCSTATNSPLLGHPV
ncbi:Cyclin-like protein [Cryptosporidium felis]|nr:Cyclin-like protein [Cryptosporidium felis]